LLLLLLLLTSSFVVFAPRFCLLQMRVSLVGLLALVLSGVAAQVDNGTLPAVYAGELAALVHCAALYNHTLLFFSVKLAFGNRLGDLVRTCMMIVYSLDLRRAAAMRILQSLLTSPAAFCNVLCCCWSLLLDRAGTVAPELAATDAPVEVVATDAPVEVAATDAPTELAATVAPTELATTTDKIVQYCTAGFSYVPGGDCCCGPDCAVR
jgi:hypothetical protein